MAEQKLVDKLNKYSKHRSKDVFYDGEKQENIFQKILKQEGHYNGRYTEFGGIPLGDLKTKITNWAEELKKLSENEKFNGLKEFQDFKTTIENLQTNGFLNKNYLNICGVKACKRILKVLSKIKLFMNKFEKKAEMLKTSPFGSTIKTKYLEAIKCYKNVLEKGNETLLDLEKLETFDTDAFAKELEQSNLKRSNIRDLEVVRALEFTGIFLKRENGKWVIDTDKTNSADNTNGIAYNDGNNNPQYFRLEFEGDGNPIQSFLDEYLNQDEKNRNGAVITPEGIFRLYLEESTNGIKTVFGLGRHAFGYGKDNKDINQEIEKAREKFSVNSSEWKSFVSSSERLTVADASKLALIDLFKGNLSSSVSDDYLQDVQDVVQNNDLVNKRWVNKFFEIGNRFNDLSDSQIQDAYAPANDIVQKYTEKEQKTLELVKDFELEVVKKLLDGKNLQGETLKIAYVCIINQLSESDFLKVVENDKGEYELSINKDIDLSDINLSDIELSSQNIYDACNNVVTEINDKSKEQGKSAQVDSEKVNKKDLSDDQIFNFILENVTNESKKEHIIGDALEKYEILKRTESLTADGKYNEIIELFTKFREMKEANPNYNGTLEQFIEDYGDKLEFDKDLDNALFTTETLSIVEALSRSKDPQYINSGDYKNAVQKHEEITAKADMYYVLIDRIRKSLKSKYPDLTAENLTPEMVNAEYKNVIDDKNKNGFNTTPEEIAQAKAKYEGRFHRTSMANAFDKVSQDQDSKGTRLKKDFMNEMVKTFGEDFLKEKENQSPETEEGATKTIKFGDKYPKKDESALLNKFKPYCAKSTSKIIDNLLKMIKGIEITIKDPSKLTTVDQSVTPKNPDNDKGKDPNPPAEPVDRTADEGKGEDDGKSDNGHDADRPAEEPEKEPNDGKGESELKKPEEENDKKQTSQEQICHNAIGIPDRQFATYRMLAVGLQDILKGRSFEQNRKLLNGEERHKIDSLSKVLNYIVSEPKDKEGEEAKFKNFLAWEIDYKSRTTEDMYGKGTKVNNRGFFESEFPTFAPEIVDDINNVIFNMKNLEELGTIIGITTDREKNPPETGNKLTDEMVESIMKCKDDKELWQYMRQTKELYDTGLWYVPVEMSSKLELILANIQEDERNQAKAEEEAKIKQAEAQVDENRKDLFKDLWNNTANRESGDDYGMDGM